MSNTNIIIQRAGSAGLEHQASSRFFHPEVNYLRLKVDGSTLLRILPAFDFNLDQNSKEFWQSWVPAGQSDNAGGYQISDKNMVESSPFFINLDACYGAYSGWSRNSFSLKPDQCPVSELYWFLKSKGEDYKHFIEKRSKKEKALVGKPSTQCLFNAMVYDEKRFVFEPQVVVATYTTIKFLLLELAKPRTSVGHPVSSRFPNTAYGDPTDPMEGYMCRIAPGSPDPTNPSRQSAMFYLSSRQGHGFTEQEYRQVQHPLDAATLEKRYALWDTNKVLLEPPSYQEIVDMYVEKANTPEGLPLSLLQEAWSRRANVGPSRAAGVPAEFGGAPSLPAMPAMPAAVPTAPPTPAAAPAMPAAAPAAPATPSAAPAMPAMPAAVPTAPPTPAAAPAMPAMPAMPAAAPAMPAMPAMPAAAPAMPAAVPTAPPTPVVGNPLPAPGNKEVLPGPSGFPERPSMAPTASGGMPSIPAGVGTPPPAVAKPVAPAAPVEQGPAAVPAPKEKQFFVAHPDGSTPAETFTEEQVRAMLEEGKQIRLCDSNNVSLGWKEPSEWGFGKTSDVSKQQESTEAEKSLDEWITVFQTEGPQAVPAHLIADIVAKISNG